MSEEQTVEQILDEAAAARAKEVGIAPAKAEDEGKSATPAAGGDTADLEGDEGEEQAAKSEDEDAEGKEVQGDDSGDESEEPKPKPPTKAQKRIRRLVRERDDTAERLRQAEAEKRVLLAQLQNGGQKQPADRGQQRSEDAPPNQDDYPGDYAQFLADTAAWAGRMEARKAIEADRKAMQDAQIKGRAEQRESERVAKSHGLFEAGENAFEDFAEVAGADSLKISDAMTDALLESEEGHKVLYHLGQNPEEAERIYKMSPVAQVRELTKLEAKISKPAASTKKTTSASEPIKPVKAGGAPRQVDEDSCSMDEYMKIRADRLRRGEIQV